jgi:5-methylcytosine-specific restriction endonuclease McrA
MRKYQREWRAARRAAFFADKSCVRCGSTEQLELDHIDPSTKDATLKALHTAAFWSWSMKRIEAEIAKCQVLCRDCHEKKTMTDMGHTGHSRRGYAKGCRCTVCVESNRGHQRRRRARIRKERAAAIHEIILGSSNWQ